jgi:hypothetical protein
LKAASRSTMLHARVLPAGVTGGLESEAVLMLGTDESAEDGSENAEDEELERVRRAKGVNLSGLGARMGNAGRGVSHSDGEDAGAATAHSSESESDELEETMERIGAGNDDGGGMSSGAKKSIAFTPARSSASVGRRRGFMWKQRLSNAAAGRVIFSA